MPITNNKQEEAALIAGITPYFLERGVLWFKEHNNAIRKKARREEWWRLHTCFVEPAGRVPFSPFLKKLTEMGYVKTRLVENRGEFAVRGGIVDVFPVNMDEPIRIEFYGNIVERVLPVPISKPLPRPGARTAKDATEHERMWLARLKPGDYVVHVDHGIGIFRGFAATLDQVVENDEGDKNVRRGEQSDPSALSSSGGAGMIHRVERLTNYYVLEYAPPRRGGAPDRLFVPRDQAKKISRYIGFDTPVVHRLGGTAWEGTLRKAEGDALKFASELLFTLKNRSTALRPPYPQDPAIERELEHSFAYEITDDQIKAIRDIHRDLSQERPMDRLLIGDVGFGKTEVAVRASARVAASAKQVAVLTPTTILADQHFATFTERLRGLPLKILLLSRLTPKRGIANTLRDIKSGLADIVIGTHRLLSKDVSWRGLGLVIIDEEQRFGVRHKEAFKKLRAGIDVLSLSATPIPRTLSLALAKFRDISLIHEPPRGRLAIQTFVLPYSERIVAEAIRAEKKRGGQVFYLWNRIENIESARRALERLAPSSRIAVLHGRVRERELIRVMHDFRAGAIDILIATTIIENGLDLPAANTLIVANATRLGLSQAYQIRGRIGRGEVAARAYFLYPRRSLNKKSAMRLRALREAEGLGSGFSIALKDLEIRGAGNVLGKQQSGAVNRVGLNLYAQMLNDALESLE